jgi:methylated-DNA-[protein]-cysteine S-methyltransferase
VAADLKATSVDTPLGRLTVVVSDRGVLATMFGDGDPGPTLEQIERRTDAAIRGPRGLAPVRREVEGYFSGRLRRFATPIDLVLASAGFPRRVLEVTARVPYGELWTYGDVAARAGAARGGRAAGNALARCPIELFVPCHRVVHAGAGLGGYGPFTERKRWLIEHEARNGRTPGHARR